MRYKKGNLIKAALAGEIDVICHGCNNFHKMSAGIAKQIKQTFPSAYQIDKSTKKGDRSKLGTISTTYEKNIIICNLYTQHTYWDKNDMLSYDAINQCFKLVAEQYGHLRIGIPKIGSNLARGNWDRIVQLIDDVTSNIDITVYVL